jgi:hypothetical protein
MPRDRIEELFGELSASDVPVPAPAAVVARGRQRRLRARVTASVSALAVLVLAGSAAASLQHAAGHGRTSPVSGSASSLPPAGTGPLLLGLNRSNQFVMARLGSTAAPVRVRRLRPASAHQSLIATDPAGGWVISYATGASNSFGGQPARLATVSITGAIRPFGPSFSNKLALDAIAVRPDGSAVAVALQHIPARPAQIELVPMPGHSASIRTWTLGSQYATIAKSLSWAPDGASLSYIPGNDATGGGFAPAGAAVLNTQVNSNVAPGTSFWPVFTKAAGSCQLDAGAWVGGSATSPGGAGRYLALQQCGSSEQLGLTNIKTGAAIGTTVTVPGVGCPAGGPLDPDGGDVLIMWCGVFLDSHNHITLVPGSLSEAAWAGGQ